jgi:hydroxymethylbilane synthase
MAQTGPVRIGTRGSRLALWQAGAVRGALAAAHGLPPEHFEIVSIRTPATGFRTARSRRLAARAVQTGRSRRRLSSGTIDLAVHSAKDMETFLPEGLMIAATLEA